MIDPRPSVIEKRLSRVKRIVAVGGGKGGVGKTTISTLLSLGAAALGMRSGLLDLDVHGGAAHLLLGIEPRFPEEQGGICPLAGPMGLHFMSATAFSGDRPLALRGGEVTDAITELLAVTVWPELDLLVVDLPPGLGESLLDVLRYIPRAQIIAVTTPSAPALGVADRFLAAVSGSDRVLGVVANMIGDRLAGGADAPAVKTPAAIAGLAARHEVPVIAALPADAELEAATGRPDALLGTRAAIAVRDILAP